MDAVIFACQLFVGAVLLMSGVIKLLDPRQFRSTVNKYAIVPIALEWPTAALVIAAEMIAAGSLLTGEFAVAGSILAGALFVAFIGAVALNIRRGAELDCGCFGLLWREKTGWPTIVRDAILLSAAVAVTVAGGGIAVREPAGDADRARDLVPLILALALAAGAAWIALLAHRANRAVEPPPPTPENLPPPVLRNP